MGATTTRADSQRGNGTSVLQPHAATQMGLGADSCRVSSRDPALHTRQLCPETLGGRHRTDMASGLR